MLNIYILGASGMLGYSIFTNLSEYKGFNVFGTVRNIRKKENYFSKFKNKIIENIDISDLSSLEILFQKNKPDIVINCIGLIKQHSISKQYIQAIKVNALLPHELAHICDNYQAKLIHFSTDCVFDGKSGNYQQTDIPTATDLYGRTKHLGEVTYGKHLTLRTSIIGHELSSSVSLVDWFLNQKDQVNGYTKAIFSGFPTCYIAKLLAEKIIPNKNLNGLYHLSSEPIDKYTLLSNIAAIYHKNIIINPSDELVIDRSLNSTPLRNELDFNSPSWNELIKYMYEDYNKRYKK
ncbi:dTDP-4-dehydrorhamnose reductase family protein [Proteus vulgaris]|uniref:dTDP-4-dehydrorhamnose reductase n=1 Tax=Proteus vulgaris TaxID=585 RepID=A0A385JLV2_PROVU|nr:SDR family oxidoreductase [Proteus vulgaris]AXY99325.1 qnlA [Proteus vulgaris]KGA56927.1 rmlD substrate binding domain protein [Proteus vulgaris]UBH61949.1 SDR family oxidoreductase [Proteus vulgaris]VTP79943.1 dTDP-4-dehydrorhamnose reductase [Proteus vulgaris]HCN41941.1 SDR family NAD(P)-dependent oxidoreductase [Proteus vulgaris]